MRGVAPGATIMHFAILPAGYDADGSEVGQGCEIPPDAEFGYEITAAVDQAVAAGADIITTSIGTHWADGSVDALLRAYAAGVVVLAAPENQMSPGDEMLGPDASTAS